MKIGIASDHRGYKLKEFLKNHLDYEMIDYGTTSEESVDYPDFGISLGEAVGIGISIACNKVKGIRCAKVSNKQEAKYTRNDNDANIIALSAEVPEEEALEIITTFINTPFSNEERHIRRIITVLVIWSLDSININSIFKKNKVIQAKVFYFFLALSLIYLVTNFFWDFFLTTKI